MFKTTFFYTCLCGAILMACCDFMTNYMGVENYKLNHWIF